MKRRLSTPQLAVYPRPPCLPHASKCQSPASPRGSPSGVLEGVPGRCATPPRGPIRDLSPGSSAEVLVQTALTRPFLLSHQFAVSSGRWRVLSCVTTPNWTINWLGLCRQVPAYATQPRHKNSQNSRGLHEHIGSHNAFHKHLRVSLWWLRLACSHSIKV